MTGSGSAVFGAVFRGAGQGGPAQAPAARLARLPDPDHRPPGGGPARGPVIDFRVRDGHVRPDEEPRSAGAYCRGQVPTLAESGSTVGAWPSGKARDFGSRIRRFESSRPNQNRPGRAGDVRAASERHQAMIHGQLKLFSGSAHPALARGDRRAPRHPAGRRASASVSRHRGLVPDRREHPRHGRLHRPADVAAGR